MSQGCEQCRWMPGTIEILEATVDGLHYELHMRELRIKQQDKTIAQLEQQVEELKKQALQTAGDQDKASPKPPAFVKANVVRRRRRKPGRRKGHEPALLGKSFDGTLTSDFYSAYDKLPGKKQRCLTHLMREVRELDQADQSFADCPLSRKLMRWCREALRLKKQWKKLKRPEYQRKVGRLEDRLEDLAAEKWEHPDAMRLGKRLSRYRTQLTRFLSDARLEATNNAAERALRPAVVMRKITGGSRSQEGAAAWATLASLLRTADQRGLGVYDATQKLILDYWAGGGR